MSEATLKVRIKDLDGIELEEAIEAIETSNPYLCIHPSNMSDPLFFTVAEAWTITHISSGAAVISLLPSKALALVVVEWLSSKHDWSLPFEQVQLVTPREVREAIRAIRFQTKAYVDGIAEILEIVEALPWAEPDPKCPIHGEGTT